MTPEDRSHIRLNRAYVQAKVIATNLEHLGVLLSAADLQLQRDLEPFTARFGQYIRRMNRACDAVEIERVIPTRNTPAAAAAGV